MRHVPETTRYFGFLVRNGYPNIRSDFCPDASVVLPRKQSLFGGGNVT
jgi:hypothetical protein